MNKITSCLHLNCVGGFPLCEKRLTHFHEELSLLHRGLASFTAFLDHSAAHQTAEEQKCDTQLLSLAKIGQTAGNVEYLF